MNDRDSMESYGITYKPLPKLRNVINPDKYQG